MEAPSCQIQKKIYEIEKKSIKYKISLYISSNSLGIEIETINSFPSKFYHNDYIKEDLEKVSKLFKMNDSIEECLINFVQFFDEKKFSFEEDNKSLILTFAPGTLNIKDFSLTLNLKELNLEEKYTLISEELKKIIEENEKNKNKISEKKKKNEELENRIKVFENFFKILKKKEDIETINNWIAPNKEIKYILKYNAKRDDCDTDIFHEKCDNIGKCLLICRILNGDIIGGYITENIEKKKGFKSDSNAFLFNLSKKILKKNVKGYYDKAFYNYDDTSNFIKFGDCDCLRISGKCMKTKDSYADTCGCNTNFDCSNTNLLNNNNEKNFQVENFEVYQIKFD